jgi:hypothetical protein
MTDRVIDRAMIKALKRKFNHVLVAKPAALLLP